MTILRVWPAGAAPVLALAIGAAGMGTGADATTLIGQFLALWLACRAWQSLAAQVGWYSFGHAIFLGAGAYAAVWTMRALGTEAGGAWLALVPVAGALAGALAAAVAGLVAGRTRATAFAMLSFGLCELVHLLAQSSAAWFGGEAGLGADRALGQFARGGFGFASPEALSPLLAIWVALGLVWFALVERSALGASMRLVRDNPLRAQALGLRPAQVRRRALVCAGLGAGVAGALLALQFEVATPEVFSTQRSLTLMIAVLIGGIASPWGAAIGAAVHVLFANVLGLHWASWQLGYGALFVLVVLVQPGGIAAWRPRRPA